MCFINYCVFISCYSYDDYDYGEVNQLLQRDLKMYIKAVACFPDATKTPVCPLSLTPHKSSERVRGLTCIHCKHLLLIGLHVTYEATGSSSLTQLSTGCMGSLLTILVFSTQIHVNLLIMEARLQAELLYALRAITQYMVA